MTWMIGQSEIWNQLVWGAPQWIAPALGIGVALVALVLWGYARPDADAAIRWTAGGLKTLAIVLLALCLVEPMRSGTRPRPQANVLPIVVDTSQSMQLKPAGATESRQERVAKILADGAGWRLRLSQSFDVRQYAFDARLESVDDFSSLQADGFVSSMATSLQSLSDRLSGRPVAGVLLFSDGNLTDLVDPDFDWSSLGFPVYPVLPGSDGDVRDLRVADVSIRQTDFESSPVTVNVTVDGTGMSDEKVFVQLRDLVTGKMIEEQSVSLQSDDPSNDVRFRFRPDDPGVAFYAVNTFTQRDRDASDNAPATNGGDEIVPADSARRDKHVSREATLLNNTRLIAIDRGSGPYRVLYVAGRPNWEFKFLRRALEEDAEVQLIGLLRIANKEPKFSFRDQGINETNPLFAGLGDAEEEAAQQYDEPVIIRLGVRESDELSEGFPESAEELFSYHAVILDDLETEFFTQDQMLLLRRFVGTRGGGLLFLGGQESFKDRGFGDTPLGELSPVYAPRSSSDKPAGPYRMTLTREGMLQPWVRLRVTETDEQDRIKSMPPFKVVNAAGELKPGASELARVESEAQAQSPAIVAQRFGKGRTMAVLIADLWRWSMRREDPQQDDSAQAWRQMTHWLVNDVPRRADVQIEQSADPSQPVNIVVTARDEAYLPLDNADVDLTVTPLDGKPFKLKAEMDDRQPGVYTASYWSRRGGAYRVRADITAADGTHVGSRETGWTTQASAAEFHNLRANRTLLESIAQQTGGEIIRDDSLDAFATDLPKRDVPVTERWVYPIWHRPWVLGLAVVCLCCEWGLRRWKGMA